MNGQPSATPASGRPTDIERGLAKKQQQGGGDHASPSPAPGPVPTHYCRSTSVQIGVGANAWALTDVCIQQDVFNAGPGAVSDVTSTEQQMHGHQRWFAFHSGARHGRTILEAWAFQGLWNQPNGVTGAIGFVQYVERLVMTARYLRGAARQRSASRGNDPLPNYRGPPPWRAAVGEPQGPLSLSSPSTLGALLQDDPHWTNLPAWSTATEDRLDNPLTDVRIEGQFWVWLAYAAPGSTTPTYLYHLDVRVDRRWTLPTRFHDPIHGSTRVITEQRSRDDFQASGGQRIVAHGPGLGRTRPPDFGRLTASQQLARQPAP